jgi:triphosphatase
MLPLEIESKFRVPGPQVFEQLLGMGQIGPFLLRPAPAPVDQLNTYFDTADRRLGAARHGFRVRAAGGRFTATLKGPATLAGATHTRAEWEAALPSGDPADLADGELRMRLLALSAGLPLLPLLTIRTHRQLVAAARPGGLALEVALDDSLIEAGGQTERLCELEVELPAGGALADLEQISALLRDRFGLLPEPRSKLERGLALLARTT